ncbi:iron uptake transporter deferrochelatase/peroxidase subunit [Nocardioides sp. cx-173]|uniref:iron uptake transporter deferrochelatase/peroxidase subunit n=1 Tax=Nocardioides sp. cx-173 TaxID=2898796 RepID=UPI001E2AD5B8|nr:iron uptake transporter deferrochelatase/peroxidase subunit [Nocardioides sp. cx-173]MCD4524349.1 iron uptake transporter deferrochelatase/peroxidase subunit [Nocardioides sp. cx-173]UGB43163.1 iron uptake transporter deferrochelatase/peroxidase subunit [Nocardioides sp. cx-173]
MAPQVSRRGLLGGGVAAAGVAGAFATGRATADPEAVLQHASARSASYDFRGAHQAGIVTPAQDRLHFAALDVTSDSREDLIDLLQRWTAAAERMTKGEAAGEIGPVEGSLDLPPDDTGEAIGLPASGLTITFGFGPGLFRDAEGRDRFGLADRQPEALRTLPHFPADNLDPARSYGDLCIQACADDPQVAVHAVRNLVRLGFGTVSVRWSQLGFGRTSSTSTTQETPRNLFGFKDGTANVKAEEEAALGEHVWVGADDDPRGGWLAGGSYLVARRINMTIEVWDRQPLGEQERFVGRTKGTGAPLSGGEEFSEPDFEMPGRGGPIIPADAHVRLVHPDRHGGARMLRRGYNFVDGSDALGGLNAGLFFIAYVRDPRTGFIPVQNAMAKSDALMEYLKTTGSALFAVPPGVQPGEWVGQSLFA